MAIAHSMIVRHTFIELEKGQQLVEENVVVRQHRSRTWTDTAVEYDNECDKRSSSASTTDASQSGDASPKSTSDASLNLEEVEAVLESHAQAQQMTPVLPPGILNTATLAPQMAFVPQMQMFLVPIAAPFTTVPVQVAMPQGHCGKVSAAKTSRGTPKGRGATLSSHQWPSQCKQAIVPLQQSFSDAKTTLMLRNLPSCFTRAKLLKLLDAQGLLGHFDFVYLPIDFLSGAGLGYAFVNMCTPQDAQLAIAKLRGVNDWQNSTSSKVLDVCWSDPHQGIEMLVERYRNSRVMHGTVPDHYKPMLFSEGRRVPFPSPTKRVRPPFSSGH